MQASQGIRHWMQLYMSHVRQNENILLVTSKEEKKNQLKGII